jgi:hypothetical protein
MRWLAVTLVLLGASAALVAGIYVRDRGATWLPPARTAADFDARVVLAEVAGPGCGRRCSYELLANPRPDHWLAQIVDRSHTRCVDINLRTFRTSDVSGLSGVTVIDCGSARTSDGP